MTWTSVRLEDFGCPYPQTCYEYSQLSPHLKCKKTHLILNFDIRLFPRFSHRFLQTIDTIASKFIWKKRHNYLFFSTEKKYILRLTTSIFWGSFSRLFFLIASKNERQKTYFINSMLFLYHCNIHIIFI